MSTREEHISGVRSLVFELGEWVWLHMRPYRFPQKMSYKIAPRGDGPFKTLERINDNAYHLELPGEINISHSFNVTDVAPFNVDDLVLRIKSSEEGENDEVIEPSQDKGIVPDVKDAPMTRSRNRRLREGYNVAVENIINSIETREMHHKLSNTSIPQISSAGPEDELPHNFTSLSIKEVSHTKETKELKTQRIP